MKNDESFIANLHIPRWEELPNVELYLDQVVTLVNTALEPLINLNINSSKEVTLLTKTMINNYVKSNLIDAPNKKKYSKTQLAKLFATCILKQVYSMTEIQNLITSALSFSTIQESYNRFCTRFEEALECTYLGKDFAPDDCSQLFISVLLSCTYKLYVQHTTRKMEI